jgi:hypothetical protein
MYLDKMFNVLQPCPYMLSHTPKPFFSQTRISFELGFFWGTPKKESRSLSKNNIACEAQGLDYKYSCSSIVEIENNTTKNNCSNK